MQIVSHVSKREFVFAFLSEVTHAEIFLAAVIGEVFSFMVVQPWLRFQVLAIYCSSIFNIPIFSSEKENICCLTIRGCVMLHFCFLCFHIHQKLFARNFLIRRFPPKFWNPLWQKMRTTWKILKILILPLLTESLMYLLAPFFHGFHAKLV